MRHLELRPEHDISGLNVAMDQISESPKIYFAQHVQFRSDIWIFSVQNVAQIMNRMDDRAFAAAIRTEKQRDRAQVDFLACP